MRLLLVRHATTVWNEQGRIQGHGDSPLSARGERELEALRDAFRGRALDVVYSSDLFRALRTAEVIVAATGAPLKVDARLRERDYGELEGMTSQQARARHGRAAGIAPGDLDTATPGGESRGERNRRVVAALEEILAGGESRVAVVTHGGGAGPILEHLLGPADKPGTYAVPNSSITEVLVEEHGARLVRLADTSHLEDA